MSQKPITHEMFLCKLKLEDGRQHDLSMGSFRRHFPLGYQGPSDKTWNLKVCMGDADIEALPTELGAHLEWDSLVEYMNLVIRNVTLPERPDDTRIKSAVITYDAKTDSFDYSVAYAPAWTAERRKAFIKARQREFRTHITGRSFQNAKVENG